MGIVLFVNLLTALLFGLIWIGIITFLQLKKKKGFIYLMFFTLFYVYIVKVLDYTLFQFQSLLLLKYFVTGLILHGQMIGKSTNFIPIILLTPQDLKTSFLNILLFVPFGFDLPFITNFRMRKIITIGALFSIGIEFLQFTTGYLAKITFRIADINDVIFNTVGVVVGYILFIRFIHIVRSLFYKGSVSTNSVLQYISNRPQIGKK
jgi:glycopeptide antibiotics resistance protein